MPRVPLRHPWRLSIAVLAVLVAVGGAWLWFRDSSFTRVTTVRVTGIGSSEEAAVRAALRDAGEGMSTLHVDQAALARAVAPFSSVAGVHGSGDFPHTLNVVVREHVAVAAVVQGGREIPATAGGLLLEGVRAEDLPTITSRSAAIGGRVTDPRTLAGLRVAAAAPSPLRVRITRLWSDGRGMTLQLRRGPELVFGDARAAGAKWAAAARVLAEDSAQGATYLDLRVPQRVAAGGVGPVQPDDTTSIPDAQA
jgi:cell division protein FtsQ